jgi:UDP-N-acetylglucosamine acyltransferase
VIGGRIIGKIEPTAYVGPNVKLGTNVYVGHGTVIEGDVEIGDNNYIGHHCVIGVRAQNSVHRYELDDEKDCGTRVVIGSNNVIREFTTVHRPMELETRIGSHCYLMAYNHVSHDTVLDDRVILSNNCQIGGFTHIHSYANVGLSSIIHQFSTVGAYAMVGMGTVIARDVPPFALVMGNPIRWSGKVNAIGMGRNGVAADEVEKVKALFARDAKAFDPAVLAEATRAPLERFARDSRRPVLDVSPGFAAWIEANKPKAAH